VIRAVITDIEGTTTSVDFVFDVLFPYARERMAEFVRRHAADPVVREHLTAVSRETGRPLDDEAAIAQLIGWIDEDRKATPLKALQGMIWEAGYRAGAFTGHVYEDVARNLRAWHDRGVRLYVYSSGSVPAQRLLFGYSDAGDLTPLFDGYFDTRIGGKRDTVSYVAILDQIGLVGEEVLFLSDTEEELDAASAAGMHTLQLVRARVLDSDSAHRQIGDFDAVAMS